jgi:hypothetical protein
MLARARRRCPTLFVRLGHQGTPSVSYSDDGAISSSPAHTISPLEGQGFEPSVPRRGHHFSRPPVRPFGARPSAGEEIGPAEKGEAVPRRRAGGRRYRSGHYHSWHRLWAAAIARADERGVLLRALLNIGFPIRQSCCPVLRLGPGLPEISEVTADRSELSNTRSSISDGRDHGKQFS